MRNVEYDYGEITVLETKYAPLILGNWLVGSRAYGLDTPQSDSDYRGVFVLPSEVYLRKSSPIEQVAEEGNNRTWYALRRFCELASASNPISLKCFLCRTIVWCVPCRCFLGC